MNIKDKPVVNYDRIRKEFREPASWVEGTLDEMIEQINTLKKNYPHVENLQIDYEWYFDSYDCFIKGFIYMKMMKI